MNFILVIALLIYIFYISISYYESHSSTQKIFVILLFIIHFTTMVIAYNDTITFTENDAFCFYNESLQASSWGSLFGLGSSFLNFLIYPLVHAGVSLFGFFLLFATISYQAFLWYFRQMAEYCSNGISTNGSLLIQGLFLLPSFHYWSGLLGKDVLVFFLLTYLIFQFQIETKVKYKHILVSVFLILLRPHIFGAIFIAFIIYCLTQRNISKNIKIQLSILSLTIAVALVPLLMFFINIKTLSYTSISEKFIELNLYAIKSGNSFVSLEDTLYIERIWLLLFRPLFYDANTSYQYIISFENSIVLVVIVILYLHIYSKNKLIKMERDVLFAFLAGSCIMLMIAVYIYNLGLASRMRLMFLPLLFYVLHQLLPCEKRITR